MLTFNYISAEAAHLGPMTYADYSDGRPFPKEYFLVAGADPHQRGMRRSPFEEEGGYTGEPRVARPGHLFPTPRLVPGARL